jgi:hypothetical protein
MKKTRHLVCYDYGQGALWAYVYAASPEQIEAKFRDLEIVSEVPAWLTPEEQRRLSTQDVDSPTGWLAMLVKPRPTS